MLALNKLCARSLAALTAIGFSVASGEEKAPGSAEKNPASDPGKTEKSFPGADNTKRNKREVSGSTKTPLDQGNSPEELRITKRIRELVIGDKGLSFNAKNVKIITADGRVTLRGPVDSADGKTKIEQFAKDTAGPSTTMDSQLEVRAK